MADGQILTFQNFMSIICSQSEDYKMHEIQKEITRRKYMSDLHTFKYSFGISVQTPYNHSITAVTQPNGSVTNHNLTNFSTTPSLNFNMPIALTGGSLSATSSLCYHKTNSATFEKSDYSSNIFQLSFSQPIRLHNSFKWGKRSVKASFWLNNYDIIINYIKLKSKASSEYLEVLKNRLILKQYHEQLTNLVKIEKRYEELYIHGQIIRVELEELLTNKMELQEKIKYYESELLYNTSMINDMLGHSINVDSVQLLLPNDFCIIDYHVMQLLLKKKQYYYDKISRISLEKNVIDARNNRGIQVSLGASVGMNSTAENISNLWDKKTPTFNVSISAKIPISDFKERKNQYKISQLQIQQFELASKERNSSEDYSLEQTIRQYNNLITSLEISHKKEEYLNEEIKVKQALLLSRKILFDEYYRSSQKLIENEINKVSYVKELYNCIYKLESLTLYDLVSNADYSEILNSGNEIVFPLYTLQP